MSTLNKVQKILPFLRRSENSDQMFTMVFCVRIFSSFQVSGKQLSPIIWWYIIISDKEVILITGDISIVMCNFDVPLFPPSSSLFECVLKDITSSQNDDKIAVKFSYNLQA